MTLLVGEYILADGKVRRPMSDATLGGSAEDWMVIINDLLIYQQPGSPSSRSAGGQLVPRKAEPRLSWISWHRHTRLHSLQILEEAVSAEETERMSVSESSCCIATDKHHTTPFERKPTILITQRCLRWVLPSGRYKLAVPSPDSPSFQSLPMHTARIDQSPNFACPPRPAQSHRYFDFLQCAISSRSWARSQILSADPSAAGFARATCCAFWRGE